ncbi:MAG: hypothetical protein WB540_21265 [Pseudolabrys sp.]
MDRIVLRQLVHYRTTQVTKCNPVTQESLIFEIHMQKRPVSRRNELMVFIRIATPHSKPFGAGCIGEHSPLNVSADFFDFLIKISFLLQQYEFAFCFGPRQSVRNLKK